MTERTTPSTSSRTAPTPGVDACTPAARRTRPVTPRPRRPRAWPRSASWAGLRPRLPARPLPYFLDLIRAGRVPLAPARRPAGLARRPPAQALAAACSSWPSPPAPASSPAGGSADGPGLRRPAAGGPELPQRLGPPVPHRQPARPARPRRRPGPGGRRLGARRAGRRSRATATTSVRYGWPLRLAAVVTVLTYVVTGVAKLRYAGGDWLSGDTLLHQIAFDNARKKVLGDRTRRWPPCSPTTPASSGRWACSRWWSSWARRSRCSAGAGRRSGSAAAWTFHVGIVALMWISFPYPLSLIAFAPLFAASGRSSGCEAASALAYGRSRERQRAPRWQGPLRGRDLLRPRHRRLPAGRVRPDAARPAPSRHGATARCRRDGDRSSPGSSSTGRPTPTAFDGTVFVEWLNVSGGLDAAPLWHVHAPRAHPRRRGMGRAVGPARRDPRRDRARSDMAAAWRSSRSTPSATAGSTTLATASPTTCSPRSGGGRAPAPGRSSRASRSSGCSPSASRSPPSASRPTSTTRRAVPRVRRLPGPRPRRHRRPAARRQRPAPAPRGRRGCRSATTCGCRCCASRRRPTSSPSATRPPASTTPSTSWCGRSPAPSHADVYTFAAGFADDGLQPIEQLARSWRPSAELFG